MAQRDTSTLARRFLIASVFFLLCWQVGILVGISRQTSVVLGLYGFVFHTIFGKAYSLVPTYFNRSLTVRWAPGVQLTLTTLGVILLAYASSAGRSPLVGSVGAVSWIVGILVFLISIGWSIRTNLTGRETATGTPNASRAAVDRVANGFMLVAIAYLAVGSYGTLAIYTGLPAFGLSFPRVTHLLGAGAAAGLLFAVGFRLLPRFLVADPPRWLVAIVLPTGAIGPAILATNLGIAPWFQIGALLEVIAVIGFTATYLTLLHQSERHRIGFYGVLVGVISGTLGVSIGLSFAFNSLTAALVTAHLRANLLGFLGTSIVGVVFQFYPPAVGSFRGASDRTGALAIGCLGGGLFTEIVGLVAGVTAIITIGEVVALCGASLYTYLLLGLFRERFQSW